MIYLLIMENYNTKLRDVVHRSSRNDKLAFNEQIELFSGGFKLEIGENKGYVSFECTRSLTYDVYAKRYSCTCFRRKQGLSGKSFNLGI
jgi:hypothetical protein